MASEKTEASVAVPRGRLLLIAGGALAAAALIVCGAILPAEFDLDPLGLGKLTGIIRLWAPGEVKVADMKGGVGGSSVRRAREYPQGFRTDTIEIPLTGFLGGRFGSELEYKVRMKKDATLIYEWEAVGPKDARDFHYDFHGHTTPKPGGGEAMTVATYKQAYGLKQQGALTAPFDGIQGWLFSNSSDDPIVVRVKLAGFYDLIASGQPGNEAGVVANVPAAQARPKVDPREAAEAAKGG
jgi:hypothetical protein